MSEVKEELNKALLDLIQSATNAKDFLVGEIPDVVEQLLSWHFVSNLMQFMLGIIVLICSIICVWKGLKNLDNRKTEDFGIFLLFMSAFSFIFSVVLLNFEWLKIWVAPKVWLIEYISRLV